MKETVMDLQNRRSVKEFKKEQVSDAELMEVIKAGMNAPTGGNKQSPIIIAVQNPSGLKSFQNLMPKSQAHRKALILSTALPQSSLCALRRALAIL